MPPRCNAALLLVQVTLPGSQLSLSTYGSGGGQPLLALPHTPPQAQPGSMGRQPPVSQAYRNMMGHNPGMMQPPSSKVRLCGITLLQDLWRFCQR